MKLMAGVRVSLRTRATASNGLLPLTIQYITAPME